MSKTLKNILMGFTLLCVVVLVVFCVELILINRGNNDRSAPVISNVAPEDPAGDELQNGYDPFADDPFNENGPFPPAPEDISNINALIPPNAQRESFLLSEIAELAFYIDMDFFERFEPPHGLILTHLSDGDAKIEISFDLISPLGGINAHAVNFLYNYLDGGDTVVEGMRSVGNSQVRGVLVTGENAGDTFYAWLIDISDLEAEADLALVIVINYSTDEQRDMIYTVLDTMSINMLVTAPAYDDLYDLDDIDDTDD